MGSPFRGSRSENRSSKLEVAKESILTLMTHLNENDAFSLVSRFLQFSHLHKICFDDNAYITQKPEMWKETDQTFLKDEVMKIEVKGGTSLTAGIDCATEMI